VAGLGVAFALSRQWPREHTVRIVLGDAAKAVEEVRLRYGDPAHASGRGGDDDWQREVIFHYAIGRAPRVVSHEPRLPDGDYDLELEIGMRAGQERRTVTSHRVVHLDSDSAQVDVASTVRDSLLEATPVPPPPPLPLP